MTGWSTCLCGMSTDAVFDVTVCEYLEINLYGIKKIISRGDLTLNRTSN